MAPAGFGGSVEGLHPVAAALGAGRVTRLLVEARRSGRAEVAGLVERARGQGVSVEEVDDLRLVATTAAPQGVLAECRPIPFRDLDDLVGAAHPPALVVVDHVEDPHNVGAIARSAAAAGMNGMVVPGRRGAPLGPAAFKAAAGALERLPVAQVSSIADALARLADMRVWTVGLDASGSESLFGLALLTEPVAIVVGGETGLHRLVRERCDVVASIAMASGVESLNASVAAALACFEVRRVRG